MKERNYSVDLVKVIAMIMVLLLHTGVSTTSYMIESDTRNIIYAFSCIAVPLFFMVSGYLMSERIIEKRYVIRKTTGILKFVLITTSIVIVCYNVIDYVDHGAFTSRGFGLSSYLQWIIQKGYMWQYWYFASMVLVYIISLLIPGRIIFSYRFLLLSIIISFAVFCLNILYSFETNYLPQSFRMYYWLMYYSLGGMIHKNEMKLVRINWLVVLPVSVVYILFQYFGPDLGGNEYYFGSFLCMIYAVCVFCACLNTHIVNGSVIRECSMLFLPVYAFHVFILMLFGRVESTLNLNCEFGFLLLCMIHCFTIISVCWLLMKNVYLRKIFVI